jgi:ABC-type Fe3+/spermidine/putrescine transport system ATPase subunit
MLSLQNISHAYGTKTVLHQIHLQMQPAEILCLLGHSGCGKTTLLRIIAGLETQYDGEVIFAGKLMNAVPVHARDFGLMFQDFALFPHRNVAQNVAFGLKMRGIPHKEQAKRVADVLSLVKLHGYEKRDVASLSGGEKQRVALARSLAPAPRLLLLDEPLGSLDAALRERLMLELRDIIKAVGLSAIYVTHDREEAFAVADRIAIMNAGQIEQIDAPENIYYQPETRFVARFMGFNNILPVLHYAHAQAETALGTFTVPAPAKFVLIHPDSIHIDADGQYEGSIIACLFQGDKYQIKVAIADITLMFKIPADSRAPEIGQPIRVNLDVAKIIGFPL